MFSNGIKQNSECELQMNEGWNTFLTASITVRSWFLFSIWGEKTPSLYHLHPSCCSLLFPSPLGVGSLWSFHFSPKFYWRAEGLGRVLHCWALPLPFLMAFEVTCTIWAVSCSKSLSHCKNSGRWSRSPDQNCTSRKGIFSPKVSTLPPWGPTATQSLSVEGVFSQDISDGLCLS